MTATTRYLGNAFDGRIELSAVEGTTKVQGTFSLPSIGGVEAGIWEVQPAEWDSVGSEELFVVISGKGKITFQNTGETVNLYPGAIVKLNRGEHSRWQITEQLRKIYIIGPNAA